MLPLANTIDKHVAEGSSEHLLSSNHRYRGEQRQRSPLRRMIVLDVLTDPTLLSDADFSKLEHELDVRQAAMLRSAPRDTVIAIGVANVSEPDASPATLLLPLLSHVRMPIRPGEHVLALFEDVEDAGSIGFWLSRLPSVSHVDDSNIMHHPREHDRSFAQDITFLDKEPEYAFLNGVKSSDGVVIGETATLRGEADAYESLVTGSYAGSLRVIEPVERYKRRVDDLSIEGARGALIVVGSERTSLAYKREEPPKRLEEDTPGSAAIHLSVGRGRGDNAAKRVKNSVGGEEIAKHKQALSAAEGDHDFVSDAAYVHISARSEADAGAGEPRIALADSPGASVMIKCDDSRTIARRSVRMTVTGFEKRDDGTLADDKKEKTLSDLSVSGDTGDADLLIARDMSAKIAESFTLSAKNTALTAEKKLQLQSDAIEIGGKAHPAPAFDAFCTALANAFDLLSGTLSAGTSGSPAAQKLNGAETFLTGVKQFVADLRQVAASSGPFASKKVKNG